MYTRFYYENYLNKHCDCDYTILLYAMVFSGSFLYRHFFFAIKHFNRTAIDHQFTTLVRVEWGA